MLLNTSLSLSLTQLIEEGIDTPAEGIVVPLIAVQIVKSLEFRVGNDEI